VSGERIYTIKMSAGPVTSLGTVETVDGQTREVWQDEGGGLWFGTRDEAGKLKPEWWGQGEPPGPFYAVKIVTDA